MTQRNMHSSSIITTAETKAVRHASRDERTRLLDSQASDEATTNAYNTEEVGFKPHDERQGSPTVAIVSLMLGKDT